MGGKSDCESRASLGLCAIYLLPRFPDEPQLYLEREASGIESPVHRN